MLPQTIIETDRLLLRELSPGLLNIVFSEYSDDQLKSFFGVDDAGLQLEKDNHSKGHTTYRLSFKTFLLVSKETGRIIGRAGFHTWYLQHARAELGYALTDDSAGQKGLMTEAVAAIIDHGFTHMGLNRIEAMAGPANIPSLKILNYFGFSREGLLRSHFFKNGKMEDSAVFGLLKSEWVKK